MKTNQPNKIKNNNNQDGPWPILATYKEVVVVNLLNYIYINKSFHTLKIRLWFPEEIPGQIYINEKGYYNITSRIAKRDNNSNIINKQEFKNIFNIYNKQIDKHSLIHYIKQKYHNKKTQESEKSLKGISVYYLNSINNTLRSLNPQTKYRIRESHTKVIANYINLQQLKSIYNS